MKRILLTGISGVGKSSVTDALVTQGYKAVDTDCDEFSEWAAASEYATSAGTPVEADRDWVWRENRIQELLDDEDADVLFMSGSAPNMGKFLTQFDQVILLSAPAEVIVERLATRTNNAYGKKPDETARVVSLIETVEPLLRRAAHHEIDSRAPLDQVVATVLRLAQL